MTEYFLIATISSAEGEKGFLKINSLSGDPERFNKLKKVFIDFWGEKKVFSLDVVKIKKGNILIKFKDFDDKQIVDVLIGKQIYVDKENLRKLPKGHYYIHDIVGSKVLRNDEEFGIVTDVYAIEANDVYEIKRTNGKEILIPGVHEFIDSIDTLKKVVVLKPGKDIYEDDAD